jgi:hypothetical protein
MKKPVYIIALTEEFTQDFGRNTDLEFIMREARVLVDNGFGYIDDNGVQQMITKVLVLKSNQDFTPLTVVAVVEN